MDTNEILKNLEDSFKNQKVTIDLTEMLRTTLQLTIANSYLLREVITRQIEVEQRAGLDTVDPEKAWNKSGEIFEAEVERANETVSALLAKWGLENPDHER
ncbi:MAG TPA: hypothetical protein VK508_01705 [Cyclobacteriaceae bacterium]|nr:hypothetical protein [Cyclobacteriaceae bacterium]